MPYGRTHMSHYKGAYSGTTKDEPMAFPCEWSITLLPATMPLNITMKVSNERKTIITKQITM